MAQGGERTPVVVDGETHYVVFDRRHYPSGYFTWAYYCRPGGAGSATLGDPWPGYRFSKRALVQSIRSYLAEQREKTEGEKTDE